MDERKIAKLGAHENNIKHYQGLLRGKLSEVEKRFLERRLSEERFAIEMLIYGTRSSRGGAGCDGMSGEAYLGASARENCSLIMFRPPLDMNEAAN
ncbi:hypothetical protein [Bradyrhizobium genosp. P]|uniref:hypothetical protein n=1 Tax=Bradyrhizobium genosp. P TaxID=83641 RepID=UPI003CE8F366